MKLFSGAKQRKTDSANRSFDINRSFADLLDIVQLKPQDTGGAITFTGEDPIIPSNHRLGAIMAMGMMGPAAATQILYRMRGGSEQDLSVDLRGAVAHINPMALFKPTSNGYPYQALFAAPSYNPMAFGIYKTKDGRSYLPTAAYPKMIPDWLSLLRCDLNEKSVREAISKWKAQDLEDAGAARGMIGSICRTPEEWRDHPQGKLLANVPLVEIIKIGDSAPEMPKLTNPERPLVRVQGCILYPCHCRHGRRAHARRAGRASSASRPAGIRL
jgi:hypothetical protein